MLASVRSAALFGVEAYPVRVEVDVGVGLPNMLVVGLPGAAVQESRERVRAALENSGLPFPLRRIVVNLSPADVRKEGPSFDLPIALALLLALGSLPPSSLQGTACLGELALDGTLRPVRGVLSVAMCLAQAGVNRLLVPVANAAEAAAVTTLTVVAIHDLREAVDVLRGHRPAREASPLSRREGSADRDLGEVRGQSAAKRALEVAAAGGHNLLLTGPPGSGKTMLATRLPGLLPDLTADQSLAATRVHSAAGMAPDGLIVRPPFRSPHHTVSYAGLVGGGGVPRPGEVSLAHEGILFLDEIPEFGRQSLEALRQPLEEGEVTVSRVRGNVRFPARFMLVASRNPCPCGLAGGPEGACMCTPLALRHYRSRLSGPLLDRIDLRIEVPRLTTQELLKAPQGPSTSAVRDRVARAREAAVARQGVPNRELTGRILRRHCRLDAPSERFIRQALDRSTISGRGFERLLRVARSIADLGGCERVGEDHLAEALAYRGVAD